MLSGRRYDTLLMASDTIADRSESLLANAIKFSAVKYIRAPLEHFQIGPGVKGNEPVR